MWKRTLIKSSLQSLIYLLFVCDCILWRVTCPPHAHLCVCMRTCVYVCMVLEALWWKACDTNDSSLFWSLFLFTVFLLWCFSSALFILPNALRDTTGKEKPTLCLYSVSSRLHISNSLRNFCFWLNCQVAENNFQDPTQSEQTLHAAKPLRHSLFFLFMCVFIEFLPLQWLGNSHLPVFITQWYMADPRVACNSK